MPSDGLWFEIFPTAASAFAGGVCFAVVISGLFWRMNR